MDLSCFWCVPPNFLLVFALRGRVRRRSFVKVRSGTSSVFCSGRKFFSKFVSTNIVLVGADRNGSVGAGAVAGVGGRYATRKRGRSRLSTHFYVHLFTFNHFVLESSQASRYTTIYFLEN